MSSYVEHVQKRQAAITIFNQTYCFQCCRILANQSDRSHYHDARDERKGSIWFTVYYSRFKIQRLVQYSGYYSKTTSELFSVWFRIQRIIKKCPGYYSASGSGFSILLRVLFKIRPAYYSDSGSGFSVIFKKISRLLFSVWFRIQRSIKKCPWYYSASGSVFSVLFRVLFKI